MKVVLTSSDVKTKDYYYENVYRTKVHRKKWKIKNKNTHEMNELGLIGTHELYHKINVYWRYT